MITVTEARQLIKKHSKALSPISLPLSAALGHTLAADIVAAGNVPAFPQSSMDGYAFNFDGHENNISLKIIGAIAAGDNIDIAIKKDEAVRIFTGAPVPPGADSVIMQEKVSVKNDRLFLEDPLLKKGMNTRATGAEIRSGEVAIKKGQLLTPAAVGYMAGIGTAFVEVYPFPTIALIVTGNELQQPGQSLTYGQVYESNSHALKAALNLLLIDDIIIYETKDDLEELSGILEKALSEANIVLLTGGVSVGDHDHVVAATENCEVEKIFHKIKQKPGKPLFFGKKNNKLIFGLPGNPSSVLTCFYQYVLPALNEMKVGKPLVKMAIPLASPFSKTAGLTHFLKGNFDGEKVHTLSGQESFRMQSFAEANCLIEIPEGVTSLDENDLVAIHLLPV